MEINNAVTNIIDEKLSTKDLYKELGDIGILDNLEKIEQNVFDNCNTLENHISDINYIYDFINNLKRQNEIKEHLNKYKFGEVKIIDEKSDYTITNHIISQFDKKENKYKQYKYTYNIPYSEMGMTTSYFYTKIRNGQIKFVLQPCYGGFLTRVSYCYPFSLSYYEEI